MGLLDTVLGAVLNSGHANNNNAQAGAGGLDLASLIPMLTPIVAGMLANNGSHGGLGGLADKFNQAGMGDVMSSWIGSGQNKPINGHQLTNVLGGDTIGNIAKQLGLNHGDTAGALSNILPGLIDQLTPHGQAPAGGLGNSADLIGMLGGLLAKR